MKKLSDADVAAILSSPLPRNLLAERYGVSQYTIRDIRRGGRPKNAQGFRKSLTDSGRDAPTPSQWAEGHEVPCLWCGTARGPCAHRPDRTGVPSSY